MEKIKRKEKQPFKLRINDKVIGFPDLETLEVTDYEVLKEHGESKVTINLNLRCDFSKIEGLILEDCTHDLKEVYMHFTTKQGDGNR